MECVTRLIQIRPRLKQLYRLWFKLRLISWLSIYTFNTTPSYPMFYILFCYWFLNVIVCQHYQEFCWLWRIHNENRCDETVCKHWSHSTGNIEQTTPDVIESVWSSVREMRSHARDERLMRYALAPRHVCSATQTYVACGNFTCTNSYI
jgi:hypothetical protein